MKFSINNPPISFQEFAGIGGDVGFFKNDVEVQANLPLFSLLEHCSLQASLNAGFLRTIDPNSKTVGNQ